MNHLAVYLFNYWSWVLFTYLLGKGLLFSSLLLDLKSSEKLNDVKGKSGSLHLDNASGHLEAGG